MSKYKQEEPPARKTRSESIDGLVLALREQAGRAVMFHQTIAELLGLGPSDMKAFDLARAEPELTPGRLAHLTGLSTSATTAVLDRLERRGLVARRRDDTDRRRVVVVTSPEGVDAGVTAIFTDLERRVRECLEGYTDDELVVLARFVGDMNALSAARTTEITEAAPGRSGAAETPR